MKACKKPLAGGTVKKPLQNFVGPVTRPQAITMANQQHLIINFQCHRFPVDGNIQFPGKIIEHPHIVIAGKKSDRYATVPEFSELPLQPDKSFRDSFPVFKPEIKNVSHEVDRVSICFNSV